MVKSTKSITVAAGNAAGVLKRFDAVEQEAERLAGTNGVRMVRAILDGNGLHALISDGKATIEILGGQVAVSVTNGEE